MDGLQLGLAPPRGAPPWETATRGPRKDEEKRVAGVAQQGPAPPQPPRCEIELTWPRGPPRGDSLLESPRLARSSARRGKVSPQTPNSAAPQGSGLGARWRLALHRRPGFPAGAPGRRSAAKNSGSGRRGSRAFAPGTEGARTPSAAGWVAAGSKRHGAAAARNAPSEHWRARRASRALVPSVTRLPTRLVARGRAPRRRPHPQACSPPPGHAGPPLSPAPRGRRCRRPV